MKKFEGTFSVCITPVDERGNVKEDVLKKFVNWQIQEGIHGLIFLGSTGEFLSLNETEKDKVVKIVIKEANKRIPILIGTGAEDTRESVYLSQKAEAAGVDGVMIIPPFYSTPTRKEIHAHYKAISDNISIPIMAYNNPNTSNVDLTPEIMQTLADIENLKYLKESTMDPTRIRDIHLLTNHKITVFGGIMGFESFIEGAKGWVAVGSNVAPQALANIYNLVAFEKKYDEAWDLYIKYLPLIQYVGGHNYVAGTKFLLQNMGLDVGDPLPPRLPVDNHLKEQALKIIQDLNLKVSI